MSPEDLAAEIESVVRACTERVTGIGAQQYYKPGEPQKFETMPFDDLAEYYEEELRDIINYAVMTHIRLRRLRDVARDRLTLPTIVCLCGSTRFWREFQRQSLRLTLDGKIVLSIGAASGTDDEHFGNLPKEDYDRVKAQLDELHLRKIELADEVLILNVGGYIGESTARELAYALQLGKVVSYLEPPAELAGAA